MDVGMCEKCNEFYVDPETDGYGHCHSTQIVTAIPSVDEYPVSVAETFGCVYWHPR